MKHFWPVMTYLSPFLTAFVRMLDTAEPAPGSVRQKEASFGSSMSMERYFFFVSSEPGMVTGALASPFAPSEVWMPEQPQESSSSMRAPSRCNSPGPPYSSGTWVFISPSSQALSMMSWGQVPSLSYSQATGRISFSANSWARSRRFFCSSVSVKSTMVKKGSPGEGGELVDSPVNFAPRRVLSEERGDEEADPDRQRQQRHEDQPPLLLEHRRAAQIGRASCRERV